MILKYLIFKYMKISVLRSSSALDGVIEFLPLKYSVQQVMEIFGKAVA